jgi:hypothetical protein
MVTIQAVVEELDKEMDKEMDKVRMDPKGKARDSLLLFYSVLPFSHNHVF